MDTTRDDAQRELLQKQIEAMTQKREASTLLMRRVEGRIEATDHFLGVSLPAFRKGITQLREKGELAKRFEELFGRIPQKKELDAMVEIMDDAVQGMTGVFMEQRGRWGATIPVLAGKLAAHDESLQEFTAAMPKPAALEEPTIPELAERLKAQWLADEEADGAIDWVALARVARGEPVRSMPAAPATLVESQPCPVVGCTTQGEHTHDAGGPAVEATPG